MRRNVDMEKLRFVFDEMVMSGNVEVSRDGGRRTKENAFVNKISPQIKYAIMKTVDVMKFAESVDREYDATYRIEMSIKSGENKIDIETEFDMYMKGSGVITLNGVNIRLRNNTVDNDISDTSDIIARMLYATMADVGDIYRVSHVDYDITIRI